jgi:hypothetical protein
MTVNLCLPNCFCWSRGVNAESVSNPSNQLDLPSFLDVTITYVSPGFILLLFGTHPQEYLLIFMTVFVAASRACAFSLYWFFRFFGGLQFTIASLASLSLWPTLDLRGLIKSKHFPPIFVPIFNLHHQRASRSAWETPNPFNLNFQASCS